MKTVINDAGGNPSNPQRSRTYVPDSELDNSNKSATKHTERSVTSAIKYIRLCLTATGSPPPSVQELCESRGGRPGLSVLTSLLVGFRGRKAILNHASALVSACS